MRINYEYKLKIKNKNSIHLIMREKVVHFLNFIYFI